MKHFPKLNTTRSDRRPHIQTFNTKGVNEYVLASQSGKKLTLQIYPELASMMSELSVEIDYAPRYNHNQLDAVGYKMRCEIMNVTYEGFYIVLSGLTLDKHELEEKNTDSALHSGVWVLRNLLTNEVITHTAFVKYALAEIPYNRLITKMLCVHAVRIPEKDIRLSVGAVNLSNLSQNYTASISASGLRYEFTDSVKNIHALGSTQDTYMHYRDSVLLPTRSGNPTFVSELTFSRGYEAIVFDEAAGTKNVYKNALFFPLVDMLNSTITP